MEGEDREERERKRREKRDGKRTGHIGISFPHFKPWAIVTEE